MNQPVDESNGLVFYLSHVAALMLVYYFINRPSASKTIQKSTSSRQFFLRETDISYRAKESSAPAASSFSSSSSSESSSSMDDEEESNDVCRELSKQFPESTLEERKRFSTAHGSIKAASKRMSHYLEWKEKHRLLFEEIKHNPAVHSSDNNDDDESIWNLCTAVARMSCNDQTSEEALPRVARMYQEHNEDTGDGQHVRDLDGMRLLHVIPGQVDTTLSQPSTYALTLALYIDFHLDRSSMEQMTVLIDVRGGEGWPNTMPHHQLPFIKNVTTLLLALFPERCHKCILYPMPLSALWIWNVVKVWLDRNTASKMIILVGPATIKSPPPTDQMEQYMKTDTVLMLEQERQLAFKTVQVATQ